MTTIEPENLADVTIDGIHFHLVQFAADRLGTQVVKKYTVDFTVPWQGRRTDYLFSRSGKLPTAEAKRELAHELRSRGEYGWRLRADNSFRGRDQWLTWSQEPHGSVRGLSLQSAEAGLRWLFFCACFYQLRRCRSVYEFFCAAEQLANRGEALHAPTVYQALCGFTPEQSEKWRVYQESRRGPDSYSKAFDGSEVAARKFMYHLGEDTAKDEILLDPRNVLREVKLYVK